VSACASTWTCQCNLGTDDEPDVCGKPAEWWEDESFASWPVCGYCASSHANELTSAGAAQHAEWEKRR
jgi:hypothetical protein